MNWIEKKHHGKQSEAEKRRKDLFAKRRQMKEMSEFGNEEVVEESSRRRAYRVALTLFCSAEEETETKEDKTQRKQKGITVDGIESVTSSGAAENLTVKKQTADIYADSNIQSNISEEWEEYPKPRDNAGVVGKKVPNLTSKRNAKGAGGKRKNVHRFYYDDKERKELKLSGEQKED